MIQHGCDDEKTQISPEAVSSAASGPLVEQVVPMIGGFVDQYDDPYAGVMAEGKILHQLPIRSSKFSAYVRYCHYKFAQEILTDTKLEKVVSQIEAKCLVEGERISLFNRTAPDNKDILIDAVHSIYRISSGDWRKETSPVKIFRRFQGTKELPTPIKGGKIDRIFEFVNIKDRSDKLLLLTFLVFAFVPERPHPILVPCGPKGSSKSSLLKWFSALIDPCINEDVPFWNEKEFMLVASQRWLVGLDNISTISERHSDLLCKLVTGAAIAKRKLYTDEDLILRRFNKVIILNGINNPVDKPDLMDRLIILPLESISSQNRLDEGTLKERFNAASGEILGGCFDALSEAIKIVDTIVDIPLPRMADFGKWGCAIAIALGYTADDFLAAIAKNTQRQNEESLDASPLASLIQFFFQQTNVAGLEGTPTNLLRALTKLIPQSGLDSRSFPNNSRSFGRKLQEIKPSLESLGYFVGFARGKDRLIRILPPQKSSQASSTSFPSSKEKASGGETC